MVFDLRQMRIPNGLSLAMLALFVFSQLVGGLAPDIWGCLAVAGCVFGAVCGFCRPGRWRRRCQDPDRALAFPASCTAAVGHDGPFSLPRRWNRCRASCPLSSSRHRQQLGFSRNEAYADGVADRHCGSCFALDDRPALLSRQKTASNIATRFQDRQENPASRTWPGLKKSPPGRFGHRSRRPAIRPCRFTLRQIMTSQDQGLGLRHL